MINTIKKYPVYFPFYAFSLMLCFLVFKQSDLTHTYTSSYAYLNGHFYDFYDYNKIHMAGNDYLPIIYLIFALWNIPLKLLGLLTPADISTVVWQISTPLEVFWSKLLLCAFFLGCIVMVGKISDMINLDHKISCANPKLLLATSPIAIFAVFIFSQYDVIGVFFTLLGVYFYFQKKFLRFALFFSIAISFKYFASIIYLPLVLLIEKRFLHLVKYGLIGVLFTGIQIGFYWHSDVFQGSFFALAGGKTGEAMHRGKAIYLVLLYILLCAYSYFSKTLISLHESWWAFKAIFICTIAYGLMFSLVRWHPQWLLILMPFISLATPYIRHQKIFLRFELLAYIAFIWLCVTGWPSNVDVTMAQDGILRAYIPTLTYFGADILSKKGESLARNIFYVYLFSPFLFWAFENKSLVKAKLREWVARCKGTTQEYIDRTGTLNLSEYDGKLGGAYLARIFLGCYFFLGITLICIYRST